MSRLSSMSPEALKAIFSPESSADLITLLSISDFDNNNTVIRICDNYISRLYGTDSMGNQLTNDEQIVYGVESRGQKYVFLPITVTLPSEEESGVPRCSLSIMDVTQLLIPVIRGTILRPLKLKLELILSTDPNCTNNGGNPEITLSQLYINSITYNADSVQCDVSMLSYQSEPFPSLSFTQRNFPGLF